jgi:hypothetical protein
MDNHTLLNSLPICIRSDHCTCFNSLFKKPIHYDQTDVLQYTLYNYGELTKYLEEINKHLNKDIIFNRQDYTAVPAIEIKRANDHLIVSINKLLLFASRNKRKGQFWFFYCNNLISCDDLTDLFMSIANTQDKSIQLLNRPLNLVNIKYLADILQQHRIILYIYQQFFNVFNYGQIIHSPTFTDVNDLNIHGFHFKQ